MTELVPEQGTDLAVSSLRRTRVVLGWLRTQQLALSRERDEAILDLVSAGLSYEAISRESGLTRGRIGQIVQLHRP